MKLKSLLALVVLLSSSAYAAEFSLSSPQVKDGGRLAAPQVFNGFGCQGGNVSPALQWKGVPAGTKSLAVTVYDPDAPTGSGWWHWVVFNLPADSTGLAENAGSPSPAPAGSVQSRTDFGKAGYGGPCPPAGDKPHRYVFTVYALKVDKLPLDENASGAMVGFYLNQNTIKRAVLTAYYSR
jgi:Raf kinase inhibitor-like YbhB/YbcL family protein